MRLLASVVVALLLLPAAVAAQCLPPLLPPDAQQPCAEKYPSWTGELAALGGNAVLGGISAGVMQKLGGGSFRDGFLRGLAGGAVIYGGKRIAVERFGGAGLVGREVAAVGASMVRNAGDGLGSFERIVLPLGPVRLYLRQTPGHPRVRVRADLMSVGWLVWALQEPELRLDAAMSLSAGAPVFLTNNRIIIVDNDSTHATGLVGGSVIMLADVQAFGREFSRRIFEHERVHIIQLDQIFLTMTDPVEDLVLTRVPGLRLIEPYIDINLSDQFLRSIAGRFPSHLERPWETESIFLSR